MMTCQQHQHCQKEALQSAEHICAGLGAKFDGHRRRIFDIIWESHRALTAAEIMEKLGNKQPPITYRALEFLKQAGLIHHITSLNAYVGCMHPKKSDHVGQLLICTSCHDVTELMPEGAIKMLQKEALATGFIPTQTHIEMLGVCEKCGANS